MPVRVTDAALSPLMHLLTSLPVTPLSPTPCSEGVGPLGPLQPVPRSAAVGGGCEWDQVARPSPCVCVSFNRSQSGTGKTATFSISVLQCLDIQVTYTLQANLPSFLRNTSLLL